MSTSKRKIRLERKHRKQEKNFFVWTIVILLVLIGLLYFVFRSA